MGAPGEENKATSVFDEPQPEESVCFFIQSAGECRYGDSCRFSHVIPSQEENNTTLASDDPQSEDLYNQVYNEVKTLCADNEQFNAAARSSTSTKPKKPKKPKQPKKPKKKKKQN